MKDYSSHVFDLDGVVLASNASKSEAFYRTALKYGSGPAQAMVRYHQVAGSISRRERWEHFFSDILHRKPLDGEVDNVVGLCTKYVAEGVKTAETLFGLNDYLLSLSGKNVIIVSGVEHEELLHIVEQHDLGRYFTGVYGGLPGVLKSERLIDLVLTGGITPPAVYYGDTQDDLMAAEMAKLDFVLVCSDSEWRNWGEVLAKKPEVKVIEDFRDLLVTA